MPPRRGLPPFAETHGQSPALLHLQQRRLRLRLLRALEHLETVLASLHG